jgi:hypothetical protein
MILSTATRFALSVLLEAQAQAHDRLSTHLSAAGLGSDISLIPTVQNPFADTGSIRSLETVSGLPGSDLGLVAVPPDFKSSSAFGKFALLSSLLETEQHSRNIPHSSYVQVSNARVSSGLATSAEFREVDHLNQRVESAKRDRSVPRRSVAIMARSLFEEYSGASSVDFPGVCKTGFVPFQKVTASTLEECWSACRNNLACTQIHFSEEAATCYLSHGISLADSGTVDDISMPSSTCRSLSPAGVETLNKGILPAFRLLPNNRVFLGSNASLSPLVVDSLSECQSACLDADSCQFGAWLTRESGKNDCILASQISANHCDNSASECIETCGSEDCVLFERNLLNMAGLASMTSIPASSVSQSDLKSAVRLAETKSCEHRCGRSVLSESVCVNLCLVEARSLCQAACSSNHNSHCNAAVFMYGGNQTNQQCLGLTNLPVVNSTDRPDVDLSTRLVDIFVLPQSVLHSAGSLLESTIRHLSTYLTPTDVRPKFNQFIGPCDVFHEGIISASSGPGVSRFIAQSVEECWNVCESFSNNQCSQIQYHLDRRECVLGDAIAKTFRPDPSIICRSLEYTPLSSANGLSGMLYVDSVGKMTNGSSYWFSDAAAPVLTDSIEECQALCKVADTGAADAVCRYGGYADCTSFHSTWCQGTGASHPDCGLCDRNPSGGVCRIPQIAVSGESSKPPPIPCAGGKCRWFERGVNGYTLTVSTGVGSLVDFSPVNGLICDSSSYLPTPHAFAKSQSSGCYYSVESLWHCESLCSTINKVTGKTNCLGGLYVDKQGTKQCRLAKYKSTTGKACGGNCGWFELAGEGKTAGLEETGAGLAEAARKRGESVFTMGLGACQQFRAIDAVITNTPSGFQYSPIEDCSRACAYFPQCSSYQVTGSVSGNSRGTCDILKGRESDCTFITCTLSSAISLAVPSGNNMTLCWTKTPLGTTFSADEDIDMEIDPGIPGYITTNARVRKFGWQDVLNKDNLALTMTMEECQSMCRVSDGCISGSWQHCQAIEQYCTSDSLTGSPQELKATCNACRNVPVSDIQPSVQFPEHLGVCKMASKIQPVSQGCYPEPCYAFEEGSENYFILSTSKSSFLLPDGTIDDLILNFKGEPKAYIKTKSLADCEDSCTSDARCRYGHYVPRTTGYGECYLTTREVRVQDGERWRLKDPQPCDGQCIVFMKLPTRLPKNLFAPSVSVSHDAPETVKTPLVTY